jgi:hypothetical protein
MPRQKVGLMLSIRGVSNRDLETNSSMNCEGVVYVNRSEIVKSKKYSAPTLRSQMAGLTHLDFAPGAMEGSVVAILEGLDIKQLTASV